MLTKRSKSANIKKYLTTDEIIRNIKEEISQMTRENKSKKVEN